MNTALNGKYELGSDIDAGVTKTDITNYHDRNENKYVNDNRRSYNMPKITE